MHNIHVVYARTCICTKYQCHIMLNVCNEVTLIINGRANQNAFCGIISVPLFSNLNLSMIAPTMKYVTNTPMTLCVDRLNISIYT